MHLTGICTSKKELQSYINNLFDTVIIGSDQVVRHPWHQDFIYYLDWVNGKKALVSYAASFGTSQLGMEQHEKKYAEKCLRRFDAFSVREESGAAIMKNEFGMDVPVLPDPTLLLKAEEYQSIIDAENMKSTTHDYVAYYFLDADRDVLADFSGKYPLVNMYRNEDGGFRTVGEWLNIIKNAKYVITDSFHGAVFSIIFHKEFAVIGTKVRGNERIDTLMKMTGLNRFFLDGPLTESLFANNIDYDSVERRLEVRRAEGYEYLKYALAIPPSKKKLLYKRGESFFRLFRIFPVLKIVPRRNGFKVRLFGIIPLLKIKDDNVKLFNFLKIGKIRIW